MAVILPEGWSGSICTQRVELSPNSRDRVDEHPLRYVILHGTWMVDDAAAMGRLCDREAEVSAHYYIMRSGEIVQMVDEKRVAFHAGKSSWLDPEFGEIDGLNDWSIGIEIGNAGPFLQPPDSLRESAVTPEEWQQAEGYKEVQYEAILQLLRDIQARYPCIQPECVLGHSDIAPGRKNDPGLHFDWGRLVDAGVCKRPL